MTSAVQSPLLTTPMATIMRPAAPNMVSMVTSMAAPMAEAWYVGQLGITALAGLALAFPMMMLVARDLVFPGLTPREQQPRLRNLADRPSSARSPQCSRCRPPAGRDR